MLTLHADSAEQYRAALASHPALLVDFHKDNCAGCRMLELSLAVIATAPTAAGVVLLKVRLEAVGEPLFRALGLRQTPTLSLFRNGDEVLRMSGFQSPDAIRTALEQHGLHASPT